MTGWVCSWTLVAWLCAFACPAAEHNHAVRGMVVSTHPLATEAGLNALKSGGNAVDAAIAVALTLGVVEGADSGIGGGCFLLIRCANGKIVAIDGREIAPAAATRDLFLRDGGADATLSLTGALAAGVPGELAALEYASRKFGRKKFADLIRPVADLAERGFIISARYAARLLEEEQDLAKFSSTRAVFFQGNRILTSGEILKQPELAATYRAIGRNGSRWFYRGPFARATEAWMKANGGILTAADFRNYRIKLREPILTSYRHWNIVTFPPPSSGGVHLAQMLNVLERFDLAALDEAARLHLMAEAMKRAFADRAYWLGDPAFARVPRGLVTKPYARALAEAIDPDHATPVSSHGTPPRWDSELFKGHTTHFSVADAEGNWIACTATINTSFGAKVVIPGTGVLMNNQMDDFSAQPGAANFFGLVGAEANVVAPGKRPLSSMSPTLVLRDGQPVAALGAAGGPRIISAVLQELVGIVDLGLTPAEAVAAPRIHHQWSPDVLWVERSLPEHLQTALKERGHELKTVPYLAVSQIVARSPDRNGFLGAADPRAGGGAAGW